MILKILFIPNGHILPKGHYVFNTFLSSEGTLYRIGTKVLRTLLIPKGQKKEDEEKNNLLTQAGGRKEKEFPTT